MIPEVLSLTSTESPAHAAMALICFTARALKWYRGAGAFTGWESNVRAFPQLLKLYIKSHQTCLRCAILFCGRGDAVVKGIKRKERGRHAQQHEIDPNFSHRYLSYVTHILSWPPFPVCFSHTHVSVLQRDCLDDQIYQNFTEPSRQLNTFPLGVVSSTNVVCLQI